MRAASRRLQGWLQVSIIILIIAGGIFGLRVWTFSSPEREASLHNRAALPVSFDLKVHYHQRPPYYYDTAAGVVGLCATPVARALEAAGITFRWMQTPPKRQLRLLRQNPTNDCIIGWYKTRERESYARYSTTIYRDQPTVALVRRGDSRLPESGTLADLLAVPDIVMLSRAGYSYGTMADRLLERMTPRRIDSGAESSEWLSILYTRRADFLLIAPEEANYLLSRTQLPRNAFRFLKLTDMPPGNRRYMMFSRTVPPQIVDRFNAAYRASVNLADDTAAWGGTP
ncbi:MAG: hypothetical protein QNJ22_16430 [Desulfosarcinaceae bacterium]|nr:hypothetical protein [Desulfosarcinaceae bacterium]